MRQRKLLMKKNLLSTTDSFETLKMWMIWPFFKFQNYNRGKLLFFVFMVFKEGMAFISKSLEKYKNSIQGVSY